MKTNTAEQYLAPEDMENQEHLSAQRLSALVPKGDNRKSFRLGELRQRPSANFIDLMNWTEEEFSGSLKDQVKLEKFVHNRIIVDGQFMQFCEEKKVSVECIYKDSAISWK